MDNFCIDMGTLLDKPEVKTLEHPELHSIHCLVDVKSCVNSKYVVLAPSNGSLYTVAYNLDVATTGILKTMAEAARKAGGVQGFAATLTGIDDGTSELKCPSISSVVMVDGKSMTLAAGTTSTAQTAVLTSLVAMVAVTRLLA
ncbi:hypothetical protein ACHHYP_06871 [Achlya hypogyna]|uniref:Uncharacterized protein n=1 Tax=Achlya hypogyna TaxID=1202772 RepID=A0A1V9YS06_ACHHY|nr:hypothetical protein ACHHYP_06871 [Achlya hypogyna]